MKISGKEELTRIALDLISEEGLEALTMSRLGKEAGLSKASLYHYYTSKEEILEEIFRLGHTSLMKKGFRLNLKGTKEEVLLNAAQHWEDLFMEEDNYPYLRAIFALHLHLESAQEEYRSLTLMLHSQVQVIMDSFHLDRERTTTLTELFSALLLTRLERVLEEETINLEDDVRRFAALI